MADLQPPFLLGRRPRIAAGGKLPRRPPHKPPSTLTLWGTRLACRAGGRIEYQESARNDRVVADCLLGESCRLAALCRDVRAIRRFLFWIGWVRRNQTSAEPRVVLGRTSRHLRHHRTRRRRGGSSARRRWVAGRPSGNGRIAKALRRGFSLVSDKPPLVRAGVVGLLSGFLPCGWLWAFVVTAAGTGSALKGAAVLAAFWAGTVPALVAVGLGLQLVSAPLRQRVPVITAILLMALGLYAILGRPTSVDAAIKKHQHSRSEVPSPSDSCCDAE
jgi:hypothetical protein